MWVWERDSREMECMFFLEVCFGCSLFLGWPFLYLKLYNQIWSHCFGVFFWHQTHISSRGILQQPKLFVVDETTFFALKILTGCCCCRLKSILASCLLLRSNLLHLSFDLFIEQKRRLTWRNWLVKRGSLFFMIIPFVKLDCGARLRFVMSLRLFFRQKSIFK